MHRAWDWIACSLSFFLVFMYIPVYRVAVWRILLEAFHMRMSRVLNALIILYINQVSFIIILCLWCLPDIHLSMFFLPHLPTHVHK